ncbi:unnamed protein product [Allacma fusca]|uniref:Rubicon Homology domain-containing protein n=1 Tax=Allacma fusca TaxID=39272 RepID=A0A8J2KZR7_9HEXA|nr:unnamed protein product [Allacma fusca]
MALNATYNERLECPDLLLENLVRSVNFILDISVFKHSVYFFSSGLNHLHSRVKAIIRHGAKTKHHLIFSQDSYAAFDTWLENCLADHSLGLKLKESRMKITTFYHDWAFIQNEKLFQAFIDCLYALSTRDLDYLKTTFPSKSSKYFPPGCKLASVEMPLNGNSVLSDPEEEGLETEFFPKQQFKASPVEIPSKRKGGGIEVSLKVQNERSQTNVPEFSYTLEASPVATVEDFSAIKSTSASDLSNLDYYRQSRRDTESNTGTKSFLESGGLIHPPALGNFPLPQKGQTLSSFLTSLSNTMPELDRENAHFNVSEALISAFEKLKVKEKTDKIKEMERIAANEAMFESPYDHTLRRKHLHLRRPRDSYTETEESEFEYWNQSRKPPPHVKKRRKFHQKLGSDGRSDSFKSTTEITTSLTPSPVSSDEDEAISSFSAEHVALSLLRNSKMRNVQLSDASELQWLVTELEAPQNLLPLPKNWNGASESESDYSCGALDKSMRLRGTPDWAPPRPQIIFTIHPNPNLHSLLEFQKYRCAGCGMKVETKYASTFRYCNYLGRYFCTGCHTLKKARLPQMIIHKWDFSPYLVSNFSASLLESLQSDPVYNVMAINPNLVRKVRLNNFRNYRIQLSYLMHYVRNCKAASSLSEEMDKFPSYYAADVDLYSLQDLVELRFSMGLPLKTKEFVSKAIFHVLHCELCKQLGFLCEVCKKDEVIFPFQVNRVVRCLKCLSCFHLKCFNPGMTHCPKCIRLSVRSQNMGGVVMA